MEHYLEELTVFWVDVIIIMIVALPGIIVYNIQKKLDARRDKKRGRIGLIAREKEKLKGETT